MGHGLGAVGRRDDGDDRQEEEAMEGGNAGGQAGYNGQNGRPKGAYFRLIPGISGKFENFSRGIQKHGKSPETQNKRLLLMVILLVFNPFCVGTRFPRMGKNGLKMPVPGRSRRPQ